MRLDARALALRQLQHDRAMTSRWPHLFGQKLRRMSASPLAYLRGAAHLFYELLAEERELRDGPSGKGWLAGDAHLENFGAYRAREGGRDRVVFDVNDFDEAVVGPFRFEILRLVTSLILASRELGTDGRQTVDLARGMVAAYVGALLDREGIAGQPRPVRMLLDQVGERRPRDLLAARTEVSRGKRRFVRGDRYLDLPKTMRRAAERAFHDYVAELDEAPRPSAGQCEIVDIAFRVAGTGSLGALRLAVLSRGKGGEHGAFLFDMKEERTPAAARLVGEIDDKGARRVARAMRACLAWPPRMLGTTKLDGRSMLVRRLSPQEDKLVLRSVQQRDLAPLARHLGALLGRAHRRGAQKMPKRPWSRGDVNDVVERAIVIAAVHEAAYLAMCQMVR